MKKITTVAGASIAAFAVGATVAGGIAIANADDNNSDTTAPTQQRYGFGGPMGERGPMGDRGPMGERGPMGDRGPGELVTGDEAQKAIDAALFAVPGTADHAHKAPDGTYRVMVTTSDNTRIVVTLDAKFLVTGQQEMPAGGRGHGPGIPATADETQKATDAALSKVPGATVLQVFKRDDGGFAVMLRTDAGRKKVVMLDANYTVESVETARKHRGGPRGEMGKDVVGPAFKRAEAAALAEVPNGTVMDVHKVGKKYLAVVKKDNGKVVVVTMNANFKVTSTKKMDLRGPHQQKPAAASTSA